MKKLKQREGITLVALIITIIVLLILAGITINLIIGEDGIIKRAQQAGKNYIDAAENEKWQLGQFTNEMDNIIGSSTNNGRTPYNSEFRNKVIAAIYEEGVETLETDTDEVIIENIGKIFEERTKIDNEIAAIADNITTGKQAYVNGELITGTIEDYSGKTLVTNTTTSDGNSMYLSIPSAGYYDENSKISTLNSNSSNLEVIYEYTYGTWNVCSNVNKTLTMTKSGKLLVFLHQSAYGIDSAWSSKLTQYVKLNNNNVSAINTISSPYAYSQYFLIDVDIDDVINLYSYLNVVNNAVSAFVAYV